MTRRTILAAVLLCATACGTSEPATSVEPQPSTTVETPPTTATEITPTPPPTTATTTVPKPTPEPMRILLTGDSLMVDSADAITAALSSADRPVTVQFEGMASRPRDDTRTAAWRARAGAVDPDLVVEFMGYWEFAAAGLDDPPPGTDGFAAAYETNTLAPWFDHLASLDAEVIVLAPAAAANETVSEAIADIVAVVDDAVAARPGVWFAPTTPALSPGGYTETLPDPTTGVLERVRRVDGIHLCPDGAERVADLVLDIVAREYGISFDDSWRPGEWRSALPVDLAVECPPV